MNGPPLGGNPVQRKRDRKLKGVVQRFLLIFTSFVVLTTGVAAVFLIQELESQRRILLADERRGVELLRRVAVSDVKAVISDLVFLSANPELHQMLENDNSASRQKVADAFLAFCETRAIYDQVRFLDETGMERIRVNFGDGQPYVVADEQLQNKAKRYYFTDAFSLEPGQVFVSPLDLNIERGEIELPLKPMIRFGTPVSDLEGRKRGIVLLNYFGAKLIESLDQASTGIAGSTMLLNSGGYWLRGLNPEDEWGFMYPDRNDRTLAQRDPDAWQDISVQDEVQFSNEQGIYTFATTQPLSEAMLSSSGAGSAFEPSESSFAGEKYYWKIVSLVPPDVLRDRIGATLVRWMPFYGLFVLLLGLVSWRMVLGTTRREEAEEKLQKAHRELRTKVEELAVAKERAEGADRLKSVFLATMSHELRTPLNSIIGFTGVLLQGLAGELNEEQRKQLSMVDGSSKLLLALINDVLDISKIEAGQLELTPTQFDAADLIRQVAKTLSPMADAKGLKIVIRVSPNVSEIDADRRRLEQILFNLTNNAVKFTDKGQVSIEAQVVDEHLQVSVQDTGIGIREEDLDELFQPFQQIDASIQRRYEGTGLGLSICRRLVDLMGGRIWVESEYGVGSTFTFWLPLTNQHRQS